MFVLHSVHQIIYDWRYNNYLFLSHGMKQFEMYAQLHDSHRRFSRACDQILLLKTKLQGLQKRYNSAKANDCKTFRYPLRMRIMATEGMIKQYYHYADMKRSEILELRGQPVKIWLVKRISWWQIILSSLTGCLWFTLWTTKFHERSPLMSFLLANLFSLSIFRYCRHPRGHFSGWLRVGLWKRKKKKD